MRFKVLDSFRGIAAIMVIFFHMKSFGIQVANKSVLISQSDIFVDFFFVLSGFVISYSSLPKIKDYAQIIPFLKRRFYRLYPLHLFTLFLALGYESLRFLVNRYFVKIDDPIFVKENIFTFIGNLTLTQSLGIFDYVSWNVPSWSISAEFYVYIIWAVLLVAFRKNLLLLTLSVLPVLFFFIVKHAGNIVYTFDYGALRCLYGFILGMLVYLVYKSRFFNSLRFNSLIEISTLAITLYFLYAYTPSTSWLMPLWFSLVVLVFSKEEGFISKLLSRNQLEFLGRYSYSYYLNHYLVVRVINLIVFKVVKIPHTLTNEIVYAIFCLGIIHCMSLLTYTYIEVRFQKKAKTSPASMLSLTTQPL
ncbi:acyltransferase family protein [Larkinella ripae]